MTVDVVLVPGLWNPAGVLWPFAARLRRAGWAPHLFSYRGRDSFEGNVARLARFAAEELRGRAAHYVGHSLGGVLVLETLNRHADLRAASALLIGSPARGSLAGRKFGKLSLARWMMGGSAACWEARPAAWSRTVPLGVIAGTVPFGMGRMLGTLPGVNDGVVCLEETAVDGMTAAMQVAEPHSWLPLSSRVAALTQRFLGTGSFA